MPEAVTPEHAERDRVATIYDELAPTWDARQGFVERVLMGEAMRRAYPMFCKSHRAMHFLFVNKGGGQYPMPTVTPVRVPWPYWFGDLLTRLDSDLPACQSGGIGGTKRGHYADTDGGDS